MEGYNKAEILCVIAKYKRFRYRILLSITDFYRLDNFI